MQNKRHEAQSLPRLYAGYYETLTYPTLGQCTPYRDYFTSKLAESQGEIRQIFVEFVKKTGRRL